MLGVSSRPESMLDVEAIVAATARRLARGSSSQGGKGVTDDFLDGGCQAATPRHITEELLALYPVSCTLSEQASCRRRSARLSSLSATPSMDGTPLAQERAGRWSPAGSEATATLSGAVVMTANLAPLPPTPKPNETPDGGRRHADAQIRRGAYMSAQSTSSCMTITPRTLPQLATPQTGARGMHVGLETPIPSPIDYGPLPLPTLTAYGSGILCPTPSDGGGCASHPHPKDASQPAPGPAQEAEPYSVTRLLMSFFE